MVAIYDKLQQIYDAIAKANNYQAEFYSLDGKKMKRMQRGVNIVRRGSRILKVRMGNEIMK